MSNVITPQRHNEPTKPSQRENRWRRYTPLVLAGAMGLALWAFSGGQRAAPPPPTGFIASPVSDTETTVVDVTTTNTPPTTDDSPQRPATYGLTGSGPLDLEPSGLLPVAFTGPAEQLVVDTAETLWWRAAWGLGHFDPATSSEPSFYTADDDLFFASVASISPAVESGVWVAGRDGTLRRFDGQTFVEVIEAPEALCQVAESSRSGVWGVGCGWGESTSPLSRVRPDIWESGGWLYRWTGRTWEQEPEGRPHQGAAQLTVDADGNVWVANREVGKIVNSGGLSVFDGDGWTTFTSENGLPSEVVQGVVGALPGELWILTYGGPSVFDGDSWQSPSGDPELDREQWRGLRSIVRHEGELVATRVFSSWKLIRVSDETSTETGLGIRRATGLVQAGGQLWVADEDLFRVETECPPAAESESAIAEPENPAEASPRAGCLIAAVSTAPAPASGLPSNPQEWQITAVSENEALILAAGRPWRCVPGTGCEKWQGEFSLIDLIIDYEGRVLGLSHEELLQLDDEAWVPLTPISAWEALRGP